MVCPCSKTNYWMFFFTARETGLLEEVRWLEMCVWEQRGQACPPCASKGGAEIIYPNLETLHPIFQLHIRMGNDLNSLVPWERYVHPPLRASIPSNWGQTPSIRLPLSYGSETQAVCPFRELRDTLGAHRGQNGAAVSGGIKDSSTTRQMPSDEWEHLETPCKRHHVCNSPGYAHLVRWAVPRDREWARQKWHGGLTTTSEVPQEQWHVEQGTFPRPDTELPWVTQTLLLTYSVTHTSLPWQ